jgi:hypothetical protein
MFVLKITLLEAVCQMTNVSGLGDFVTESENVEIPNKCYLPANAAHDKLYTNDKSTGGYR